MKFNKDDIRILMKGLVINTFSVMEFKDPELRLPKIPVSFSALSEWLEVKRSLDGLQMSEILKIIKNGTTKNDFLDDEDMEDMICNLNKCVGKSNIALLKKVVEQSKSDNDLATGFGIHLISVLAGNAAVRKGLCERNKCPCGCSGKLKGNSDMTIGCEEMWYGELDMLAGRGDDLVAFSLLNEEDTEDVDLEQEEALLAFTGSPGETKACPYAWNMSKIVAQSVVFAFTEWNRHRHKGRLIPFVILSPTFFQVIIYNPVDDILLQSNKFEFSFDENDWRPFFILWIIVNYRKFFLEKLNDDMNISCSGFKRIMESYPEKLSIFEKMNSYRQEMIVQRSTDTGHDVYLNEMIYRDCYIQVKKRNFSEID